MKKHSKIIIVGTLIFTSVASLSLNMIREDYNKVFIDWNSLSSFRYYDYKTFPEGKFVYSFTARDIKKMKYIETNVDEVKDLLSKVVFLGKRKFIIKGASDFAQIIFNDGTKRNLRINAGLIQDLTTEEYYEFTGDNYNKWIKFIAKYDKELHKNDGE